MIPDNSKSSVPVLVVGADARLLTWLRELFGGALKSVPNWMEAVAEVSRCKYSLVLGGIGSRADQSNLAISGLREADEKVKIVVYCRPILEPLARQALALGADDYLIEPLSKREFLRSLNGQLSALVRPAGRAEPKEAVKVAELKVPAKVPAVPVASDAYGWCEQLLRAGQLGTDQLLSTAEKLLAQKLTAEWVQLQLLAGQKQKPSEAPADVFVEHSVELVGEAKLLIRLGRPRRLESTTEVCRQVLGQVAGVLAALLDISRDRAALQKLAVTDELTGLYNRRYVYEFTEQVLGRAQGERFEVTVLLFDVDDFKHYNDSYGHATGDEVLRETADLMRRCSREHDLVGRFGGDEFVMIFWDAEQRRQPNSRHPQTAFALSERFRRTVSEHDYKCLGPAAKGTLTISGGLASFPWDASTVDDLFARADDALLKAKESGKNRIYIVGREGP